MKTEEKIRILFVDDDLFLAHIVSCALREADYDVHCQSSLSGIVACAREFNPHVIFLDVEVGNSNSMTIVPTLRLTVPDAMLYFVSSHTDGETISKGINLGVEGYLKKPFDTTEMIAYIQKYTPTVSGPQLLMIGNLSIDLNTQNLSYQGKFVRNMSRAEIRLLNMFATHPGQPLQKHEIIAQVWNDKESRSEQTLYNVLSELRKVIAIDPTVHLITTPKKGYQLILS
ncbi:MAG: response regulator transcription factor [Prevotellaceae bacterium]|jgi:DNA-binding response OmpR family regulator|nr:response regulator transcription factor [Prevotellaceae bacterium]